MKTSNEKDFKRICKIIAVFAEIIRVVMIVTGALIVVSLLMMAFGVPETIETGRVTIYMIPFSGFESTPELIYALLSAAVATITFFIACSFMKSIFKRLSVSDTPFLYDIADKIKGAGIALICGGVLSAVVSGVFEALSEFGTIEITKSFNPLDPSLILFGVMLLAVSYIFEYGCKLQEQSDETL